MANPSRPCLRSLYELRNGFLIASTFLLLIMYIMPFASWLILGRVETMSMEWQHKVLYTQVIWTENTWQNYGNVQNMNKRRNQLNIPLHYTKFTHQLSVKTINLKMDIVILWIAAIAYIKFRRKTMTLFFVAKVCMDACRTISRLYSR